MQCPTRIESCIIGSHDSSLLEKSAADPTEFTAQGQSPFLILILVDGMIFLYQVFASTCLKVLSPEATALFFTRAVINPVLTYVDRLPAFLLSVDLS